MGVDKPFNCDVSGCEMSFTNEDHLTVHRKKHEMCLSLNSENSNKANNLAMFVDQTPTPTRFIRNCEEVGLFQDLQSVNPFEETFRKAAESVKLGHPPTLLNPSHDGDILNTPAILGSDLDDDPSLTIPLNVMDSTSSSHLTLGNDVPIVNKNISILKDDLEKEPSLKNPTLNVNPPNNYFTIDCKEVNNIESNVFNSKVTELPFMNSEEVTSENDNNAQMTSNSVLNLQPETNLLTNVETQPPLISNNATMIHLILKLPDGTSIPVQVPSLSAIIGPSQPETIQPNNFISPSTFNNAANNNNKTISNAAKMKLRESLTQSTAGEHRALRIMNEQISKSLVELNNSNSATDTFNIQANFSHNRRRLRNDETDVKRQKFLERNRAAATRCRQKRKQWVQSLESKADELAAVNQHLNTEVSLLRTEVTHLKSMLLAHKDCPVTQQQQKHLSNLNAAGISTTTLILNNGSKVIATPTTLSKSSTSTSVIEPAPTIYKTFMSREQALALLSGNTVINAPKKLAIRTANTNNNGNTDFKLA